MLQLLPALLLQLHSLALHQPALTSLLLSVGLPAVHLPQRLQQQLWGALKPLQSLLPAWLPVAVPQQQQQQGQMDQQVMGPSCCLFYR